MSVSVQYDYKVVKAFPVKTPVWDSVRRTVAMPYLEPVTTKEAAEGWEFLTIQDVGVDADTEAVYYLLSFRRDRRLTR